MKTIREIIEANLLTDYQILLVNLLEIRHDGEFSIYSNMLDVLERSPCSTAKYLIKDKTIYYFNNILLKENGII